MPLPHPHNHATPQPGYFLELKRRVESPIGTSQVKLMVLVMWMSSNNDGDVEYWSAVVVVLLYMGGVDSEGGWYMRGSSCDGGDAEWWSVMVPTAVDVDG